MKLGWIGVGVMGKSMCGHLLAAGHSLQVFTRTKSKAEDLLAKGAVWSDPKTIAQTCQAVMLMLGYPSDVEEVLLGEQGILQHMAPGTLLIDHTTSTPGLAQRIYKEAAKKGVHSVDAPVSGGDIGAKEARLTIMCGGDKDGFGKAVPIMQKYGKVLELVGGAGKGQHTKCTNQIILAGNMIGMVEGLLYAHKSGLDPEQIINIIKAGAAGSFSLGVLGPRILARNFDPGFYIEHYVKDLEICISEANRMQLCLPNLSLVRQFYNALAAQGHGKLGTQALIKVLEQLNAHEVAALKK